MFRGKFRCLAKERIGKDMREDNSREWGREPAYPRLVEDIVEGQEEKIVTGRRDVEAFL